MKKVIIIFLTILILGCSNMSISNAGNKSNTDPTRYFAEKNLVMAKAIKRENSDEIIRLVNEESYDVNTREYNVEGKRGSLFQATYLNYAVNAGKVKSAETLLKLGADIDEVLFDSSTSIGWGNMNMAARHSDKPMMELLIKYNVNMNNPMANPPIYDMLMFSQSDLSLYDMLLENGADINHSSYFTGDTALMTAYYIDVPILVDYLLSKGADPLVLNNNGFNFASLVQKDLDKNVNVEVAQNLHRRLVQKYDIQPSSQRLLKKAFVQQLNRYRKLSVKNKESMGKTHSEKLHKKEEAVKSGIYNGKQIF